MEYLPEIIIAIIIILFILYKIFMSGGEDDD